MISVLIVEDDFRVAEINAAYVESVEGFEVIGQASTAAAAFNQIVEDSPDLILLDLYLPDEHGLALYARLKQLPVHAQVDVFVITAARDSQSVREALQLGAANYLVKPFTQRQLSERLTTYRDAFERLQDSHEVSQAEVDQLSALLRGMPIPPSVFSGNPTTLAIFEYLQNRSEAISASELAEGLGISRATAQRYLSQLVDRKLLTLELKYGTAGRPIHKYRLIEPT